MTEDASAYRETHYLMAFASDPEFVERPKIWAWMKEKYAEPARRMALIGMGGFGWVLRVLCDLPLLTMDSKSQLAIQFVCHVRDQFPTTSIFWVHGASRDTFETSYRTIAEMLLLPRRTDPEVNILALVRDWLQKIDGNRFLMVIDNADNVGVYSGDTQNGEGLASYIPKCDHGKVLITTRSREAAEKLVGNGKYIQQVPAMEDDQALQLLQSRLGSEDNESDARDLVRALDRIPLAISQAAAYIQRRQPRVTLRSYLDEFGKSQKRKKGLLRSDMGDLGRYEGVSNSVLVTWQVTFDNIRKHHTRAANLLALMSQFQPHDIPESMLHGYIDTDTDSHSDRSDAFTGVSDEGSQGSQFENDLDVLRGYSLVAVTSAGLCDMHSLVQFCTRSWVAEYGDPVQWSRVFLQLAAHHFPSGEFETWGVCQSLLPHVEPVLAKKPEQHSVLNCWAELLTNVSWYMLKIGEYSRAEVFAEEATETRKDILGLSHSDTLMSMNTLSLTYRNQGRWEEAQGLDLQLMEMSKTRLGPDHPDTLRSMNNLASTYRNQGRWEEAEGLQVQVTEMSKTKLGPDHPNTMTVMANLASTYLKQGRWDEAEGLQVQVMETRKTKFGPDHPDMLTIMANLASTYLDQGRWEEAEGLQVQVMKTSKKKLGADHPNTLTSMEDLAHTWKDMGRTFAAIDMMRDCIRLRRVKLGPNHQHTQVSMSTLSNWEKSSQS